MKLGLSFLIAQEIMVIPESEKDVSRSAEKRYRRVIRLVQCAHSMEFNGASNTVEFLQFFEEAGQSANATTGLPSLSVGDIIVMDNLSSSSVSHGK